MEVRVDQFEGIPEGSILSIRAGNVRRQGSLPCEKPVRFPQTSPLDASPFKVDVFAPLGSARLVLQPNGEKYSLQLADKDGKQSKMTMNITVTELTTEDNEVQTESRMKKKAQAVNDTQGYIEEHSIVQFVQNLMASVLADKPGDPFEYMEKHLSGVRRKKEAPTKSMPATPTTPNTLAKRAREKAEKKAKAILVPTSKDYDGPAFVVEDYEGQVSLSRPLVPQDILPSGQTLTRLKLQNLADKFESQQVASPLKDMSAAFTSENSLVTQTINLQGSQKVIYQMACAGPRESLHYDPQAVTAAIVTCGGLCPGLNAVIRELVMMLHMYGVDRIFGIPNGFTGMLDSAKWMDLTPQVVHEIHDQGGSILVSDFADNPQDEHILNLKRMGVKQLFVIGGQKTHKGAQRINTVLQENAWECSVVGIPKSIENSIPMLERTFGFDTACTEAEKAIDAAYVEATCNVNTIGLVKLMGRNCGSVAQNAVLAARNVDIVLLPEMNVSIQKVLDHCLHLTQTKGYAVVVVTDGCKLGDCNEDVGPYLRNKILARYGEVELPMTVKYIDPTYMIATVKANANDSVYCAALAHNAVHAAMAGYTDVTVAQISQRHVLLPTDCVTKQPLKRVDLKSRWFMDLVSTTLQPDLAPPNASPGVEPVAGDGMSLDDVTEEVDLLNNLSSGDEIRRLEVEHLKKAFGEKKVPTTLTERVKGGDLGFEDLKSYITQALGGHKVNLQMLKAGPRRSLHFQPDNVAAAIVTCGGLCPGLNSVIRELVMMLYAYGVKKVYGIKGGYKGVVNPRTWLTLTPDNVKEIHMKGGSLLVSDRGNPPHLEMAKMLRTKGVRQYFVLGGDGTQKGAYQTYEQMQNIEWECAVVGIPKTIDNDINLLDRSFGFDTAMSEANNAIDVAYVEATCNANCIGLVKLMGRHCGYLTMMSVLAARHVDICLLPEMEISIEKVLDHCSSLLSKQGYAVVVIAEGCGETMMQGSGETDDGGNKKLEDVGPWLKDQITNHFKSIKMPVTIKYVDPTYMVRAVPANANDSIYCSVLAQAAVHGAMAGFTGCTVGKVDSGVVYLPIKMLTSLPARTVNTRGRVFSRMLATTQQPNLEVTGSTVAAPINPANSMKGRLSTMKPKGLAMVDTIQVHDTSITIIDGYGQQLERRSLSRDDLIQDSDEIRELHCFHLSERFGEFNLPTPISQQSFQDKFSWTAQAMFLGDRVDSGKGVPYCKMVRAGPREFLHFDPNDPAACAAIVSCGGICPGLNSVIREIVFTLWSYGVRNIYGIIGGYKGVIEPENWIKLTPDLVKDIHLAGGTMLISDRGNPDHGDMAKTLQKMGVRQYFVLGGDGTHKGIMQTFEKCLEIDHECACIGVPKTIDNDVPMFDQTFGFDTACTEAVKAVDSAYVEACCNANCIGLVKLMGRHCGFIAMNATLAARTVDICLLPEMDIDIEKVLKHIQFLMSTKGHAVIVVAEGCGDTLIQSSGQEDAGGNKVLADVGPWLKDTITRRFKEEGKPLTIKYIDPTYMIRSVPANSFDSSYCSVLGQNAVHGAMAGYSGVTVGKVYERYVYLPIHAITMQEGKRVNPNGRWFFRLRATTNQPDFSPDSMKRISTKHGAKNVLEALSSGIGISSLLQPGDTLRRLEVCNLGDKFRSGQVPSPMKSAYHQCPFVTETAWSTQTFMRENWRDDRGHMYYQMLRSGPRDLLHFDPATSRAVIVTCGGLCPGLNSVIREIVMNLTQYGVKDIFGCKGGYKGMVLPEKWIKLTPELVQNIHMHGGTILVSDRGNPPHLEIAKTLQAQKINLYFVIGGDGTQTGAFDTFTNTQDIGHEVAVVGVPKTIDNDIPILDRSFGFNTACEEAEKAIDSAYVEARSNSNSIGLVKLMGRHCGFIALNATLAARTVDICMIPEMDISLPRVLSHCMKLIKEKGHCVIVVAEGCGDTLLDSSGETDAGGNKKITDVGPWLRDQLYSYFKKMQVPLTIKYIDPTYTIRAVPANANDSVYCSVLAQMAVHTAMAGYTGCIVGKVDERYVMLPTHAITRTTARRVNLQSRPFERLLATTGQPSLKPGPGNEWALLPPALGAKSDTRVEEDVECDFEKLNWKEASFERQVSAEAFEVEPKNVSLQVLSGWQLSGEVKEERALARMDLMRAGDGVRTLDLTRLSDKYGRKSFSNPMTFHRRKVFLDDNSWMIEAMSSSERLDSGFGKPFYQMVLAGPRQQLHFDPKDPSACAVIVTCGGLCPGENTIIREMVVMLHNYGCRNIYGVRNGLPGIENLDNWTVLTPHDVQDIHGKGGTVLQSGRGLPNHRRNAAVLKQKNARQFFAIGGFGTQRGVCQLVNALLDLDHECACAGVPTTVDNNIHMIDKTPGFDSACTEARKAVDAAYVEATCNANCIGLVKLLGMDSGFLALNTVLSSRHVDMCLLTEMEISLEKVLDHCEQLMATKGYAVIVVADGCGASLFRNTGEDDVDTDVGPWLRDKVMNRFKAKSKPLTVKYIDPTYMVRSVKANCYDSIYCSTLAEHAVHGSLAGYTGFVPVKSYEKFVYVPVHAVAKKIKRVNPRGRWFGRMTFTTGQPGFEPEGFEYTEGADDDSFLDTLPPLAITNIIPEGSSICRLECAHLSEKFPSRSLATPLKARPSFFIKPGTWTSQCLARLNSEDTSGKKYLQMIRSGPRSLIHFDPQAPDAGAAAIVTCGGLCPGLNSVIRELVNMLLAYGVQKVYGIIGGFKGCVKDDTWIELTRDYVQDIHMQGGSVLVSDRGNPPHSEIAAVMKRRNIRQYFVLGGDGTHKGAMQSFEAMQAVEHECAVVGVPKTIDNDITIVDQTFGFDTACTEAQKAIDSAYCEATTNANCIGLVKLMGRHCGWIAAHATIAARNVDVCLLPEMSISLPLLLNHIASVLKRQKYCVVVVAEGCGDTIIEGTGDTDAGGNKLLADVGPYLKDQISAHCKQSGIPCSIKYIDPTYMIRSVPANAYDSMYCSVLAQQAVHAAMAGYTGITVGKVDERYVMLPIHSIVDKGARKVDLKGSIFEQLVATTRQPSFNPKDT